MKIAPIRQQYLNIKNKYRDMILFFRLGDFYETFDDDAKVVAKELEITLTSREMGKGNRIPLAGIPYHAVNNYLAKLINRGYKIAICEQINIPQKGLVDREVIRVITPGTLIEPFLLQDKSNNFLVSLAFDNEYAGISYVDISTGEFATTQVERYKVADELERLQPSELIFSKEADFENLNVLISVTRIDDHWYHFNEAYQTLTGHFGVVSLEGFGCENLPLAIRAAGAIIHYISETQNSALSLIARMSTYHIQDYMIIDLQTRRNLEIFNSNRSGTAVNSLISMIDLTKTANGGRLLKKWMGQPLLDISKIAYRHKFIDYFKNNITLRRKISNLLTQISDLERIINRIKGNSAIARDLLLLSTSYKRIAEIKFAFQGIIELEVFCSRIKDCQETVYLIDNSIADEGSETGYVIKNGFSDNLDKLKKISLEAKEYLTKMEKRERERTGIKSLKVQYNRVFGYFIEISKSYLDLVPEDYIRKQTLANGERFYTPELKEYEFTILNVQEKIQELESLIFKQICQQVTGDGTKILDTAQCIAEVDLFIAFADIAEQYNYIRPEVNNSSLIEIKGGRHPVVERTLGIDEFIPNDVYLNNEDKQIIILTGPNMSGKSTYLKQVALIVLMAQLGSFVPADSAKLGIVDRIFTRIGAQEDLAAGQSTFMIEMIETANILNNATNRSLVILDEVGRGTSTYDGLSIAWAIVEYLHNQPNIRAKTLFATHYHELVELANLLPRVTNCNVAVTEENGKVIFLHKIISGSTDKSYGIHVAQLAGVPSSVLGRAEEILFSLENGRSKQPLKISSPQTYSNQLALFDVKDVMHKEILSLDIDSMTPLEAMTELYKLKQIANQSAK